MDVSNGNVYGSMEKAIESGAGEDNLIEISIDGLEGNKMLIGVLKFLIKDNAFDREFLLTTIIDYVCNSARKRIDKE